MHEKTKTLILSAVSALLVSCGGGGGSTPDSTAGTTGTAGTPSAPVTTGTGSAVPPATSTPSTTTTPPAATTPPTTTTPSPTTPTPPVVTVPPPDQPFNGYLDIVADQIVYVRTNRVLYLPVTLAEFLGDRGVVDIASGSKTDHVDINLAGSGCTIAVDGTCGIQPTAAAPAAPIATFGIRVDKHVQPTVAGQVLAKQTSVGRIALDLTERSDSPGILGGEVAEIMRFVIDKVEMTTDESGSLTSVRLQDGAQIHVYGRNAAGVEVREDIPAPSNTVRLQPLTEIPDGNGDTTSAILFLDLEAGFSRAGTKLTALENIAGQFAMRMTISNVTKLGRKATGTDLVGTAITVNSQPPVNGAGIAGNIWVRMYPSK